MFAESGFFPTHRKARRKFSTISGFTPKKTGFHKTRCVNFPGSKQGPNRLFPGSMNSRVVAHER